MAAQNKKVNVVAHRGFSSRYPENTEVAFRQAMALGVETIEFDVRLTREGGLAVIHDGRVDRTTDGSGRVADLTLAEIKALDAGAWLDEAYRGERVPTLAETLETIGNRVRLNVHLKPSDGDRQELVSRAVAELERHGSAWHGFVASDEESLAVARRMQPRLEICNLSVQPAETYVTRSLAMGCRILQPRNAQVDTQLVREAHRHGMEVNPFYANDEEEMRRLMACGVDGILTDCPDVLLALRDEPS